MIAPADLPAVAEGTLAPVVIPEAFAAFARRQGVPVELLASYVLEEWIADHGNAAGLVLLVADPVEKPEFAFTWAD